MFFLNFALGGAAARQPPFHMDAPVAKIIDYVKARFESRHLPHKSDALLLHFVISACLLQLADCSAEVSIHATAQTFYKAPNAGYF
jgi:hypothetical protein